MSSVAVAAQLLVFAGACLIVLWLIGYGIVDCLWDDESRLKHLLAPSAGVTLAYLSFIWLGQLLSTGTILVAVLGCTAPLSVFRLWHRHRPLSARRWGDATSILLTLLLVGTYVLLVIPVISLHTASLASAGPDEPWVYAPAAEYLRSHAYHFGSGASLPMPLNHIMARVSFLGGLGTLDGAMSSLLGWPTYAVFNPLSAVLQVVAIAGVYVLAVLGIGLPRLVGLLAALLMATNHFLTWEIYQGFDQQIRVWVVMSFTLTMLMIGLRSRRHRVLVLAGLGFAALPAVYFPLFTIAALCGGTYAAATVVAALRNGQMHAMLAKAGTLAAATLLMAPLTIFWLTVDGGLGRWLSGVKIQGGSAIVPPDHPFSAAQLLGTAPFNALYHWTPLTLSWGPAWVALAVVAAVVLLSMIALGLSVLLRRRRFAVLSMLVVLGAYCGYVRLNYPPYNYVKSLSYVMPLACILVALGFSRLLPTPGGAERGRRIRRLAVVLALTVVAVMQTISTAEDTHMFAARPAFFTAPELAFASLPVIIPAHASVLMYNPGSAYAGTAPVYNPPTLYADRPRLDRANVYIVAACFLPDRDVMITLSPYATPDPVGDHALTAAVAARYDYVMVPIHSVAELPAGYRLVWLDEALGLELFVR